MPKKRQRIENWTTDAALLRLQSMTLHGMTIDQICAQENIPRRTFYRWRKLDPRLDKALQLGKEAAVASVENALFKKAIKGDLGSMCFFLKNRAPDFWSEHPELNGQKGAVLFVDDIPNPVARNAAAGGANPDAAAAPVDADRPGVLPGAPDDMER